MSPEVRTLFSDHPSPLARKVYLVLVVGAALCIAALFAGYAHQQGEIHSHLERLHALAVANHRLAVDSHRALCAVKANARASLRQAVLFQHLHPHGTAVFSEGVIKLAIYQQRQRLRGLRDVRCASP